MTFGYSRDDVSKFLPTYISQGILQHDPFEVSFIPWLPDQAKAVRVLMFYFLFALYH
jgi:hypothetical protein